MTKRSTPPPMPFEVQKRLGTIDKLSTVEQERLQRAQMTKSKNFRDSFQKR